MKKRSIIEEFLTGYEATEKSFDHSKVKKASRTFKALRLSGSWSALSRGILKNKFTLLLGRITLGLSHVKTKNYGIMMLAIGFVNLFVSLLGYYSGRGSELPLNNIITASVLLIISLPLLFSDKTPDALTASSGKITSLIFETLCLKRSRSTSDSVYNIHFSIPLSVGAFIGAIGCFIPLLTIILSIFAVLFLILSIKSPEFSFMMTLLFVPIFPILEKGGTLLALGVCLTLVSFGIKVILGKRTFHFEQYDLVLTAFFAFIFISGVFNKGIGSFENGLMMIVLGAGYLLSSNVLVNRRLSDNAAKVIIFSSFITAIGAIIAYVLYPTMDPSWIDSYFGGSIEARMTASFGNPNIYAVFLIVSIIFSMTFTLDKTRGTARLYYLLVLLLNLSAMLLTYTRGAWLALIIAIPAFIIIMGRKTPKLLLLPLLLLPVGMSFLPQTFIDRFLSIFNAQDSSLQSRLSTWRASISMFLNNIITGVGIGEESFREEFAIYSEGGLLSGGNHAHNLFLEIGCEAGIFALILFMLLPLIRARHIATYKLYIHSLSLNTSITMTSSTVFALLVFGMTDYVWYSYPLYYLFWVVFGIGSAMLRIGKREYDELLDYRYSGLSAHSSSIDLTVE